MALNQLFCNNRFDKLPDSLAQNLVDKFSLASDYGDASTVEDQSSDPFQESFERGISYNRALGKYMIDIPWNDEVLEKVPDNFLVSKVLARKVYDKLKKQNLHQNYFDDVQEQLSDGVIEPLPQGFSPAKYKFIPHRLVIRNYPLVATTKICSVFNCSFRTNNRPSLNDAVDHPPDLHSDLVDLFLYFRSNNYFLTADIKKAFLNIHLKSEYDMSKFSFIIYHESKYYYFKFSTVLFGFVQSPYFLHAVLKFHANCQPDVNIQNLIKQNFYVDNLLMTGNSQIEISNNSIKLYEALNSGEFHLRQWNSNVANAAWQVASNDNHTNCTDPYKLLGFVHNPSTTDALRIKNVQLDDS